MTGLTLPRYQALRAQLPKDLALFNGPEFEAARRHNPLKQLLAKTFRLQAHLVLPLQTAHCGTYYVCFFSRQPQTYQPHHLQLLRQLQSSLTLAVDRLMAFGKIKQLSEQLRQENTYLLEEVKTGANYEEIIGQSPLLCHVYQSIDQVAPTHLLERAAIMTTTPEVSLVEPLIAPTLLQSAATESLAPVVKSYLQAERDNVLAALQQANYRIRGQNGAAELLGIKPTTLESRIFRLGIHRDQKNQ